MLVVAFHRENRCIFDDQDTRITEEDARHRARFSDRVRCGETAVLTITGCDAATKSAAVLAVARVMGCAGTLEARYLLENPPFCVEVVAEHLDGCAARLTKAGVTYTGASVIERLAALGAADAER